MRRYLHQQPQNQKLFRGSEFLRLMTMIVMMGVVWSLISTARQPSTWKFLALEAENDAYTMADMKQVVEKHQSQAGLASLFQAPQAAATAEQKPAEVTKTEEVSGESKVAIEETTAEPSKEKSVEPDKVAPTKTDDAKPEAANTEPAAAAAKPEQPAATQVPGESPAAPAVAPAPGKPAAPKTMEEIESARQAPQRKYDEVPLDLDPEQRRRIDTEFQAIQDKRPLAEEEMPAYWRLMRWQYGQSTKTLRERARKDVLFTHLWQKPDKFRGELIRLRLHVKRVMTDTCDENIPGVKRMYDAWATTDDNPNDFYVVAFCDLPSDKMPMGASVQEEAVFYGYFLKLMSYKSKEDKFRAAPMLVGRLVWYPTAAPVAAQTDWTWPLVIVGIAVVLFGVRIIFLVLKPKPRPALLSRGVRLNDAGEEAIPVEDWLDQAEQPDESQPEEQPTNGHHYQDGRRNSSISHPRFSADFDRKEDELN